MKSLSLFAVAGSLLVSSLSLATECVDKKGQDIYNQPKVFQALIAQSENCWQAAELARACAWGSSLDVMTAGEAENVCHKQLETLNPKKADQDLLTKMADACNAHHDADGGTLARSETAYCHLSAVEFIVNLVQ